VSVPVRVTPFERGRVAADTRFEAGKGMTEFDDDAPFPEPVRIPIEDHLDLHGFRPAEISEVVDAYLDAALEVGLFEVRLIHGRGKGVQRASVQRLLARDPRVERFADAPPGRGGWGATQVWLRRS
jgi:dsDNA-specific endonuclease/ATPase MutS2